MGNETNWVEGFSEFLKKLKETCIESDQSKRMNDQSANFIVDLIKKEFKEADLDMVKIHKLYMRAAYFSDYNDIILKYFNEIKKDIKNTSEKLYTVCQN